MNARTLRVLVALQAACAAFFLFDIVTSVFGLLDRPIAWHLRELIEIGAAIGLVLGTVLGAIALRRSERRRRLAEDKRDAAETRLRAAQGAFADLMAERFDEWALTPAERDVALFSVKGLTLAEIAAARGTSEGTVKAQCAAVYRKAGVSSRVQLLSLFVDDLLRDEPLPGMPPLAAVG